MESLAAAYGRLAPGRRVHGIAATLLPNTPDGAIDWAAFTAHVARTRATGLDVAVNMDTGFGDLLSPDERLAVLDATRAALGPAALFYAGAFADHADPVAGWHHAMAALYARIADGAGRAPAFELGPVFAPHGAIWDDETFRRLLEPRAPDRRQALVARPRPRAAPPGGARALPPRLPRLHRQHMEPFL